METYVTLTLLPKTGDAQQYRLSDAAGYERKFIVSGAQLAGNPNAVTDAIRAVVGEYRRAKTPDDIDG